MIQLLLFDKVEPLNPFALHERAILCRQCGQARQVIRQCGVEVVTERRECRCQAEPFRLEAPHPRDVLTVCSNCGCSVVVQRWTESGVESERLDRQNRCFRCSEAPRGKHEADTES